MTDKGVERLVSYQRSFFSSSWKHSMTEDELAEIYMAYAGAFEGFDDELVLGEYMKHARSWKKLPTIAEIFEVVFAAKARKGAAGSWRCATCDLPWNAGTGYGRTDAKVRGQIRCPACNAVLDKPLPPEGWHRADQVAF